MTKKGKKRKAKGFICPRSNSGREEQRRPESVAFGSGSGSDLTFGIGRELSLILKEIKVFGYKKDPCFFVATLLSS